MASILRWMLTLVLLLAVAGGGAAYWLFFRSDEALRQLVLIQLRTTMPTLKFEIARAQPDLMGRVRIYGLSVFLPDDNADQPSLEIPEIIATLESNQLTDFENVVIQKVYLVKPKVRLIRHLDGAWNWQQVSIQSTTGMAVPDLEIEHASILAEFQLPDKPSRKLKFQNFNVSAHPADAQRLSIQVATLLEPAGPLTLEIDAAVDGSTWKCKSRDPWHVPVDAGLIRLISDISPEFASQLVTARRWLDDIKSNQSSPGSTADLGISFDCDFNLRIQKEKPDAPITFQALADITKGQINHGLLPFPVNDLGGKIYVDNNRQITLTDGRGSIGSARMAFDGNIVPSKPITANLKLRGVELNDALVARLPVSLRKIVQPLGLTGLCDLDATVTQDGSSWNKQANLRLLNGTVTHERYPVTIRSVVGELHLDQNVIDFKAAGKYAGQPVEAYGTITTPGPADIFVKGTNLPLDDEALAACPLPVMKAIEALKLKGRRDILLRVSRPDGIGQKFQVEADERFFDGSLSFNGFPYRIQQVEGFLKWNPELVEFKQITGVHDGTKLIGHGTFQRAPLPGRLDLNIEATEAAFDRSLEVALPPRLRQVWQHFQPKGNFDVKTKISWVPGSPCEIIIPSLKVREGEVLMTCFPWSFQDLKGKFTYNTEPGKLVIEDIHARHDDTHLSGSGIGWFPEWKPWRLEFTKLNVDNLVPNATFRNALPVGLQRTFDFLRPTGTFSFQGPAEFSELKRGDQSIGAAWKLRTVLSRCAINAGTRIDDINGVVQLNGSWDGSNAKLDGDLDLDSLSIFRQNSGRAYQITGIRGPISFRDSQFVAGSEAAIPPRKSNQHDPEKRIRGNVISGKIFLDTVVDLGDEPRYRAFVELEKGLLESYAQQYLRGRSKLAGVMNGWMNVRGKGTEAERMLGEGKLVIAPAALYELPLFAQMFQLLQLQSLDKTAFEQAEMNFTIGNGRFDFNSIELLGDSLSMRGRGYVRFDGGMQLDFGLNRRQWIPNPLTRSLMAVKVTGEVGDPKTNFVPWPELDDAMRQFLGTFDPRRMAPRTGAIPPRTGQNADNPVK